MCVAPPSVAAWFQAHWCLWKEVFSSFLWTSHSTSFITLFDLSDASHSATFFHRTRPEWHTIFWPWVHQGFLQWQKGAIHPVLNAFLNEWLRLCLLFACYWTNDSRGLSIARSLSVLTCHFQIQCFCTWLFRLLSPDVKPSHFYVLILICHIFALVGLKHRFLTPTLSFSHSLWTEWLSQWLLLNQSSFSWPFEKLFEFQPCMSQEPWSSFIFDTIPQRIFKSAFDSFALENTPGAWLNIMILEKLAARGQA